MTNEVFPFHKYLKKERQIHESEIEALQTIGTNTGFTIYFDFLPRGDILG